MSFLLFSVSMAILVLEVFYTRLFSALLWHNTAFAVLSLALLGIGASGLLVYFKPQWFSRERVPAQVAWLLPAFALATLASHLAILHAVRTEGFIFASLWTFLPVAAAALPPFLVGGLIVSVILTAFSERISRLYFWDMCGASLGALVALSLLTFFNGPLLVIVIGLFIGMVGILFALASRHKAACAAGAGVSLLLLAFSLHGGLRDSLNIHYAKGRLDPPSLYERWDAVGRVTLHGDKTRHFLIDGNVVSPVIRFNGNFADVEFLKGNILQLAHHLGPHERSVVIGPGGGSDLLAALLFGGKDITAVEINRSIIELMRRELLAYSGELYRRPEIKVEIEDGRSFLAHMRGEVDLIQATFIDTYAAASSGSHTLNENYLYTTDAMHDYLDHLTPQGIVSVSRWGGNFWGYFETYRVVAIAERVLRQRGVENPQDHIAVVQGPQKNRGALGNDALDGMADSMATVLISPSPFSAERLQRLDGVIGQYEFRPLWIPGRKNSDAFIAALFAQQGSEQLYREYYQEKGIDIRPTSDDQPFFFGMVRPVDFPALQDRFPWRTDAAYTIRYIGILVLYQVLAALACLTLALIAAPLLLKRRDIMPLKRTKYLLAYFTCLGLGFMGIELGFIQRFSLFLTHPVYSLVIVLAAMLFFSSLGSLFSDRIRERAAAAASRVALLAAGILFAYAFALPAALKSLIVLPFAAKAALAMLVICPPAFLMGMLFPLGVKSIAPESARLIPWMWGLNAGFSVLAGVLSLYLSMSWGFTAAWLFFTAVYLLASLSMRRAQAA